MRYAVLSLLVLASCASRQLATLPPIPASSRALVPHSVPHRPLPRPSIPDAAVPSTTKERTKLASVYRAKLAAVETGLLHSYATEPGVGCILHKFDVPDEWKAWLVQRRAPEADSWEEVKRPPSNPSHVVTITATNSCQYRLVRTAP